uniref:Uncharacterized protein n=1 Tax=Diadromus pulchellus ascovirus 4a TaxID=158683 RepID=Q9DSW6_9VIRU|nr:hypothetical protein [Diadromus pulchellus ascovirus 4a]
MHEPRGGEFATAHLSVPRRERLETPCLVVYEKLFKDERTRSVEPQVERFGIRRRVPTGNLQSAKRASCDIRFLYEHEPGFGHLGLLHAPLPFSIKGF